MESAREARRTTCENHLKQLSLAVHNFESVKNRLPSGSGVCCTPTGVNWTVAICPFMELQNTFDELQLDVAGGLMNSVNKVVVQKPIATFASPSDPKAAEQIMTRFASHNASSAMGDDHSAEHDGESGRRGLVADLRL